MATLVNQDQHGHRYWLKHPDGKISEILPKGIASLTVGHYQITSVEPAVTPVPHIPPPTEVTITNVGQETIHFTSIVGTIVLKEGQSSPLKSATYAVTSDHIGPK